MKKENQGGRTAEFSSISAKRFESFRRQARQPASYEAVYPVRVHISAVHHGSLINIIDTNAVLRKRFLQQDESVRPVDWRPSRRAEREYQRQLRDVARQVRGVVDDSRLSVLQKQQALRFYSRHLESWALETSTQMVLTANRKNMTQFLSQFRHAGPNNPKARQFRAANWFNFSESMGQALAELMLSPMGAEMAEVIIQNQKLITSLPDEAADMLNERLQKGLVTGLRPEELAQSLSEVGNITMIRANTIARTEIGKTQSLLTEKRALHAGSEAYFWRTAEDRNVRDSHAELNGMVIFWSAPPLVDGQRGHAGTFYNDRCYAEPILVSIDRKDLIEVRPDVYKLRSSSLEPHYQMAA